jgi:hypothetical protein
VNAPLTVVWAAKGGSGTTTVAAALALINPHDTLLVDLDGELPAVVGLPEPHGHGLADWLPTDQAADALPELTIELDRTTRLLPCGRIDVDRDSSRWPEFMAWAGTQAPVVVDAGTGIPPTGAARRQHPQPPGHPSLLPVAASRRRQPDTARRHHPRHRTRPCSADT